MATPPSAAAVPGGLPRGQRAHRPWLAAVLSFIFPGLGQAYAGNRRIAAAFAVPMILLVTVGIVVVELLGEPLRNRLLSSAFLVGILILNAVVFGWRGLSVAHAGLAGPRVSGHRGAITAAVVGLLLVATLAMHAWVGIVVAHLEETLTQVFAGDGLSAGGPQEEEGNGGAVGQDGEEEDGSPPEPAYRWDGTERINVLLVGTDEAPDREEHLTDVMMVASIDPVAETAVLISIPRDTGYLPLPDQSIYADGLFPAKANELAAVAEANAEAWCPASDLTPRECGIEALRQAIGLYTGLELQHYATVDMNGFADLIDAMGGVELCLPGRLVDPLFGDTLSASGGGTLTLPAGCRRYDGIGALAYARSRQGWIEMPDGSVRPQTDFDRNERQQLVLIALRNELADADLLFELPGVLGAVGRTVDTDFPREQAGDLASLLPLIAQPDIERVVLDYPEFVDAPVDPDVNYLLVPRRDSIRDEMARLFGQSELVGWYLASEAATPSEAEEGS